MLFYASAIIFLAYIVQHDEHLVPLQIDCTKINVISSSSRYMYKGILPMGLLSQEYDMHTTFFQKLKFNDSPLWRFSSETK